MYKIVFDCQSCPGFTRGGEVVIRRAYCTASDNRLIDFLPGWVTPEWCPLPDFDEDIE